MSLLYWWPLKNNYKGNTGKHLSVYTGSPVAKTDGKIDNNSFYFNGSTCLYYTLNSEETTELMEKDEISLSLWCKLDVTQDGWGQIFTIGQSGTSWTNIRFGIDNSNSANKLCFSVSDGTNAVQNTYTSNGSIQDASWHHIAAVYKKSQLYLYIDGILQGSGKTITYTPVFPSSGAYIHVGGNTGGERIEGNIQDVRVYNHALSMREIEELHNACILHYNFEDPTICGGTNLLANLGTGGNTTLSGGTLTASGINTDTYFSLKLSDANKLVAGQTYTLSCDADLFDETRWRFGLGHQSTASPNIIIENGHNSYTFVADSSCSDKTSITMDDILENTYSPRALYTGQPTTMYNFQLTKTDYEIPYLGGFGASKGISEITDSSGNGYNVTPNASFALTSDCNGRGKLAAKFNGSAYVTMKSLPTTVQTIAAWIKVDTYPTGNQVVFADAGSKLAFGFYQTSYAIISCGSSVRYVTNLKTLWKDGWNYVVVTKDNSNSFHCYVNGVEGSYTDSNVWTHDGAYFTLGCRYNSGYTTNFTGKISEIKAYVTALSIDQVKTEYRSQLRLLNEHSIQAYTINETSRNKASLMNDSIFKKSFSNGVSGYTQAHCQVTMADKGLRIYRTPNKTQSVDGSVMYGGMKLQFLTLGKKRTISYTNTSTNTTETYEESDFFKTGRRYRISFHVSGFTHNAANIGFSNNMGWGGGGLAPAPSDVNSLTVPANFGIVNDTAVGSEMNCFYEFTINDAVYKTCTTAYSSFKVGTVYPSYRDFQLQFNYASTGTNGTDLYITNIICEDITESDTHTNVPDGSTGTMNTLSVRESEYSETPIRFSDSGVLETQKIYDSGNILGNSLVDGNLNVQKIYSETLNLNNTKTKILEGTIENNSTSTDIVTSAQIKTYIDSILNN